VTAVANVPAVLGAIPRDGVVDLEVWAPSASRVVVRVRESEQVFEEHGGWWRGTAEAGAGDTYTYVVDGAEWPDPCSRFQPGGVRGPSAIVDTSRFEWRAEGWGGLDLDTLVLYELHVGTFTEEGTFEAAMQHFDELAELGVTAIEVMPIGTFPGSRNWGYDGLYTFAPHAVYGGPEGFARMVDAAHQAGLGVVLDVVYNHIGPGNESLRAFGPYFTDRFETFWGDALDYSQRGVREWAVQNAELWIRDYKVDGLRLDAVHSVFDDSDEHVLAELARRVRAMAPRTIVTSEIEAGDQRPIDELGHDAQWADELHHEVHVLLTGEREGYYANYGSLNGLARQLLRRPAERFIVCSQNHDQVGNRALGDRPHPSEHELRAAVTLFAAQTPLLFMGEEYGARTPFLFFTDHIDPSIADATREGRRREFARFAAFAGEDVPDPQDPATFELSKLDRSERNDELYTFYKRLLALRRDLPREIGVDVNGRVLHARRGDAELVADFGTKAAELAA
jgi:maltooligosyltrehalose trehalohydrolase